MSLVHRRLALACLALASLSGGVLAEPVIELSRSDDPRLRLGQTTIAGGRPLELSVGIGSGAFRRPQAPDGLFVTVSDRGPNIACGDLGDVAGIDGKTFCKDAKAGRVYPVPGYAPAIYRILVEGDRFRLVDEIAIKDGRGLPVSGLPNPLSRATTETPLDAAGRVLERSAAAVDAEAIVELADGTFWIGEENAPSLLHVAADGRILRRIVPAGAEADFRDAGYPVEGGLPAILSRRQGNRGIESLALSPDERFLYVALQNPLANPDAKAYQAARNLRLFKIDRATGRPVGEYVYELTPMAEFKGEEGKGASTARVSEMLAVGEDRLLVLDRTERTTKIFRVDLAGATDILGGRFDDPATLPSLEQTNLAEAGIRPVSKRLVLDSSAHPELPTKIEGMALFADGSLMLINDDDFGIEGKRTLVARVRGLDLR